MSKGRVYLGMFVGSTIGGLVPALWHAGMFSMSGIVLSALGGIGGICIASRIGRS